MLSYWEARTKLVIGSSAIGNDRVRLILADEGNDNYKVLHIVKVN